MQCRQQPRARLDQDHARLARVGHPEIPRDHIDRQLLDGAGQLHAGRPAANDDESQVGGLLPGVRLEFSDLERGQHAGADQGRVLDRLHARREFVPLGMTEIIVHRAGGEDQVVVGQPHARRHTHTSRPYRRE